MTRSGLAVSAAWVVLAIGMSASQAGGPQAATGSISGQVVSADRGGPIRRAEVRLVSTTPRMTRSAVSDADGRFTFQNLPATEYVLTASRPGYLEMAYGATRPGSAGRGTPIRLMTGQRIPTISLRLPRAGVIAGMVLDEFGEPAFSVPVRAMRLGFSNGERVPVTAGTVVTDDLGMYRIAGLAPGEYLVAAVPRDTVMMAAQRSEELNVRFNAIASAARDGDADAAVVVETAAAARAEGRIPPPPSGSGYVPVYYPGITTAATAQPVRVEMGQQVTGIDMRLQVSDTATIAGVVTTADGQPSAARVQLIDPAAPMPQLGVWYRDAAANGRFSFSGLVAGAYVIRAQRAASSTAGTNTALTGSAEVQLNGGTHSTSIRLQPGTDVAGTLMLGAINVPFDRARLRVNLVPIPAVADGEMAPRTAALDAGGRFVIRALSPARYRVEVTGLPAGWRVASAVFNGTDAADYLLIPESTGRYDNAVITFTARSSELSGALAGLGGPPDGSVILFPERPEMRVPASRRIHVVPTTAGRYSFSGLPAGDYRVAAVEDLEPGQQFDRAFLSGLEPRSIAVTLGEGEKKVQDVPLR